MSRPSKSLSISQINDLTLGAFAFAPTSEFLDHAVRYLSTWSGSDKLFMIIQYAVKLIVPFMHLRARLQHRAGLRKDDVSKSAPMLNKLASLISDSRMLWRLWGLLPIYQWLTSLERMPPPTRKLLTIERLQGWSMMLYYPLEHLYYFVSHSMLPPSIPTPFSSKKLPLDGNWLGLWSTRFWALYVLLQFAHLREDRQLLKLRARALSKSKGKAKAGEDSAEQAELEKRWDALLNELVVNLAYLPMTIHWSVTGGIWSNPVWEGIFGLIAGLASLRSGWKATALPTPPPAADNADAGSEKSPPPMTEVDAPLLVMRD